MIWNEELAASLDQSNGTVVFQRGVELSRVQQLAQNLADRVNQMAEQNAKTLDNKLGGGEREGGGGGGGGKDRGGPDGRKEGGGGGEGQQRGERRSGGGQRRGGGGGGNRGRGQRFAQGLGGRVVGAASA